MIVVTGAAGFIGSNLVMGLNACGARDIVAVDDLTDGLTMSRNLAGVFGKRKNHYGRALK